MLDRLASRPAGAYALLGNLAIGGELARGAVIVDGDRIIEVAPEPRAGELPGAQIDVEIIAPGLIDLQVNGGFGVEIGDDPDAIRTLSARLPEFGVTAFLPTIISSDRDHYARVFEAFAAARDGAGSRPLGLHLEGPFLSPKRAGAHRRDLLESADYQLFEELLASDELRMMTLAPERLGVLDFIRRLRSRGVLVSLGHTDAIYDEFTAGIEAGATMATHLYNAMSGFGHRAPGAVGAALIDPRVTVGLIADGVHSHPASIRLAVNAKGADRVALVSDLMPAAGMPPGEYEFGGQLVTVDATTAKLADGTLAGSIVMLDQAIRNVVCWTDATPAQAILMASSVPAQLLGLTESGTIAAGKLADLVLFDGELNVQATIVGGRIVFNREGATHAVTLPS